MHDIYPPPANQTSTPCHTQTTSQYFHNTQEHETAATQLQDYIHTLEQWLTNKRLKASTNKYYFTLITPHNAEYRTKPPQPQKILNNIPLPVTHSTKIIGVTLKLNQSPLRLHTQLVTPNHWLVTQQMSMR